MTKTKVPEQLRSLVRYLDSLTDQAPVAALQDHLTAMDLALADVAEHANFSDHQYARNLILEGDHYHLLLLCWHSGQRSPIHNHAGSTCGLRVIQGVATETVFEMTPSKLVKASSSQDMQCGEVSVSEHGFIHQVSNLQAPGNDLVTLHVYSPPLLNMKTYSITRSGERDFALQHLEHALGSGI